MSENKNTTPTTVLGDPDKIDALKKMGRGSLSQAFRIGCDILLGITTDDLEVLYTRKVELEAQRKHTEGELEMIGKRIAEINAYEVKSIEADEQDIDIFEFAVSEYMRCSPQIVYKNMTQLCEYLAGLMDATGKDDVRVFFDYFEVEPTEYEIREFLGNYK